MKVLSLGIPKTASNYVPKSLGLDDYAVQHYRLSASLDVGSFTTFNMEDDVYIVAFVRNPFDFLVSWWEFGKDTYNSMGSASCKGLDFPDWVRATTKNSTGYPSWKFLFRQIFKEGGFLGTNYIGRFETLEKDLEKVAEITGKTYTKMKPMNTSIRKPYKKYYDTKLRKLVEKTYYREMKLFGYNWDGITKPLFDYPTGEKIKVHYRAQIDELSIGREDMGGKMGIGCSHKWFVLGELKEGLFRCEYCHKIVNKDNL